MAARIQNITVTSDAQLESTATAWVAQGFTIQQRTPESVTLYKQKEFNIVLAGLGFLFFFIGLAFYLLYYGSQKDQMIVIQLMAPASAAAEIQWSEDQQYWWDGLGWRDAAVEIPAGARRSEDGQYWWDGSKWRDAPGSVDSSSPALLESGAPPPPPRS